MSHPNPNEARLLDVVRAHPGIHLREIQRVMGVSFSTVRYHVRSLTSRGDLVIQRDARYARVFLGGFPADDIPFAMVARSRSTVLVLGQILRSKGASNKELAGSTGLAKSTVSRCVGILSSLGLVRRVPSPIGHDVVLPQTELIAHLKAYGVEGVRAAVDSYLDLWDI